jgi:hypothetical protein
VTHDEKRKYLDLQRERGKLRKDLQTLSDSILIYADWMDRKIGPEKSISRPISSLIGKSLNALEMVNDRVRFGSLGVDFRKDDKKRAVEKLRKDKEVS